MKDKTRLVVIVSFVAIALSLVLFAIPEQFASLIPTGSVTKGAMGGFEFIFGGTQEARNLQAHAVDGAALVSGAGIAFLVLLVAAVVCYVFYKKSSALLLLAGLLMLTCTIMLFCVKGWVDKLYTRYTETSVGLWVPYLSASLLAVSTIGTLYVSITSLIKEAKQPYSQQKETYSYLKNK